MAKRIKIDVDDVTLYFYPSINTNPQYYDLHGTIFSTGTGSGHGKKAEKDVSRSHCDIEFKIKFDKKAKNVWIWERKNVDVKTAKTIYDISQSKSVCAVHLASTNDILKDFSETKSNMFLNVKPKTNYTQYATWLEILKKVEKYKLESERILQSIWVEGEKEPKVTISELSKIMEQLEGSWQNDWVHIQNPQTPPGTIGGGGLIFNAAPPMQLNGGQTMMLSNSRTSKNPRPKATKKVIKKRSVKK